MEFNPGHSRGSAEVCGANGQPSVRRKALLFVMLRTVLEPPLKRGGEVREPEK